MKKTKRVLLLALSLILLLCSCGAVKMDITSSSYKAKIKINDAEDGTYAEISTMSVSGGKRVHIVSSLSKGKLKIEFCEAILISSGDEAEEYTAGSIAKTVEIGPGDELEVSLGSGRYVLQLTTIGQTDGTVEIDIH